MARLALLNMLIGFVVVAVAAAAGAFIATSLTNGYLKDQQILTSWLLTLQSSAHGHSNLFGLLHIVFGLTLPYSNMTSRMKLLQTIGLGAGTFAMGPLMLTRAWLGPVEGVDLTEVLIGSCLTLALAAIALHAIGLGSKLMRTSSP
jgi:hypothetical protein